MWMKRALVGALAGMAWSATVVEALDLGPAWYDAAVDRVVVAIAVCATGRIMLWCHNRPVAEAYEVGYHAGRREAMRDTNCGQRPVSLDDYRQQRRAEPEWKPSDARV